MNIHGNNDMTECVFRIFFREQDEQAFNPTHLDMKIVECTVSSIIYLRSLLRGRAAGGGLSFFTAVIYGWLKSIFLAVNRLLSDGCSFSVQQLGFASTYPNISYRTLDLPHTQKNKG